SRRGRERRSANIPAVALAATRSFLSRAETIPRPSHTRAALNRVALPSQAARPSQVVHLSRVALQAASRAVPRRRLTTTRRPAIARRTTQAERADDRDQRVVKSVH